MSDDERQVYGTALPTATVSRADFERAIRALHVSDVELKDTLLKLAAHVVALTDELTRRIDGVEPLPADPDTPAPPPAGTVEQMVASTLMPTLDQIRMQDVTAGQRLTIDTGGSKYAVGEGPPVPCMELMPICQARCCRFRFPLATEDLEEGVIRWDYAQPYLIRQRASDSYCVHNDPDAHVCTVHSVRPRICREYDCRNDTRIWSDYEARILAPEVEPPARRSGDAVPNTMTDFQLLERVRARQIAIHVENVAISRRRTDDKPETGPAPARSGTLDPGE